MNTKSLKSQLMAAIAMVVVAAVALSSSTYAWFASNTKVTATGMKVNAKTAAGLVIDNVDPINGATATHGITTTAATTATNFDLYPVTHKFSESIETTSGLLYNSDAGNINGTTGIVDEGTLALAAAVNDNTRSYYVDYTVYISAEGEKLDSQDLSVSFDPASIAAATSNVGKATSIDFYLNGTTNYKGTLNMAGLDANTNDGSSEVTSVQLLSNETIPAYNATTDPNFLTVTMRVYIDGDLRKNGDSTKCYINNAEISDLEGTEFTVAFTTVTHTN